METADRERSKRKVSGKDNGKGNHDQLTPDDSDAKNNNKMQFDPSLGTRQLLF